MNYEKEDNKIKNVFKKIITKIKLGMADENLCKGLSNKFIHCMKYVKKLGFEQ